MQLILNHVSKTIKNHSVIRDVSLNLESGRIYGFRGKNGSGKTMLMRLICGLVFPSEGEILIDGKLLGKDFSFPPSLGALIETPEFIGQYSAMHNLEILAAIQHKVGRKEIAELLTRFDLDPMSKKKVKTFSLGMKQKLGIIAAVMENPDLIILDEPLNALDEQTIEKVKALLQERKEQGALCILSCHDREELEFLCDDIYWIENGAIKDCYRVGDKA